MKDAYQEVISATEARHSVILWHKNTDCSHSITSTDCPDRSALRDSSLYKNNNKKEIDMKG